MMVVWHTQQSTYFFAQDHCQSHACLSIYLSACLNTQISVILELEAFNFVGRFLFTMRSLRSFYMLMMPRVSYWLVKFYLKLIRAK